MGIWFEKCVLNRTYAHDILEQCYLVSGSIRWIWKLCVFWFYSFCRRELHLNANYHGRFVTNVNIHYNCVFLISLVHGVATLYILLGVIMIAFLLHFCFIYALLDVWGLPHIAIWWALVKPRIFLHLIVLVHSLG